MLFTVFQKSYVITGKFTPMPISLKKIQASRGSSYARSRCCRYKLDSEVGFVDDQGLLVSKADLHSLCFNFTPIGPTKLQLDLLIIPCDLSP